MTRDDGFKAIKNRHEERLKESERLYYEETKEARAIWEKAWELYEPELKKYRAVSEPAFQRQIERNRKSDGIMDKEVMKLE